MNLFIKLHAYFYYASRSLLSRFERFATCDHLADALREHTKALREHSAALLTKASTIDSIETHAKYLAASERYRLQREGRPHEFV
jgi:hypothetical protein